MVRGGNKLHKVFPDNVLIARSDRGFDVGVDYAGFRHLFPEVVVDNFGIVLGADAGQGQTLGLRDAKPLKGLLDISRDIIPALDVVGKGFEKKTVYLPQLLMSAEAAKSAFERIRERMPADTGASASRGRFVIATVQGDIHDIGKNIVKVMLENYSFEVIDLGKDVPPEVIVETALREQIPVVGLSALMTTTVVSMEKTIKLLREKKPDTKVIVGGAVMTQEYADAIGADFYAKDAMDTVRFVSDFYERSDI